MNWNMGNIGRKETGALVFSGCAVSGIFALSTGGFSRGNTGYLSALISLLLALGLFFAAASALRLSRQEDLFGLLSAGLGQTLSGVLGTVLIPALVIASALPLSELFSTLGRYIFIQAEGEDFALFVAPCLAFPLLWGYESIARSAQLTALLLGLSLLATALFSLPGGEWQRLFPLPWKDFPRLLREGLMGLSRFLPALTAILILARGGQNTGITLKASFRGLIMGGLLAAGVLLCLGLTYPYFILEDMGSPVYQMTAPMQSGGLMRMDKILFFFWLGGALTAALLYLFAGGFLLTKVFSLKDTRPPCICLGACALAIAVLGCGNGDRILLVKDFLHRWLWTFFLVPIFFGALAAGFSGLKGGKR